MEEISLCNSLQDSIAGDARPNGSYGDITYPRNPRLVLGRSLYSVLIANVSSSVFHWRPRDVPMVGFAVEGSTGVRFIVVGRGSFAGCALRIISELDYTLQSLMSYLWSLFIPSFSSSNAASGVLSDAKKSST